MAGSAMTFAYDTVGPIKKITVSWTSDSVTGAVSGTTATVRGYLLAGITDPGAAAPTADYDIVLTDSEGANILADCDDDLIDRHTTNSEHIDFVVATATGARPAVVSKITVAVTAAGNSKNGTLVLLVDGEIATG
jgi:hypothetical protein